MPWVGSYEELRDYLRSFNNVMGEPGPYDFMGVLHLMLAVLDNLRAHALEAELSEIADSFSREQAAFFLRMAEVIRGRA